MFDLNENPLLAAYFMAICEQVNKNKKVCR